MKIPEVNLTPANRQITIDQDSTRAFSLTKSLYPESDGTPISTGKIVDALKVSTSLRYKKKPGSTYCNIYAHDFARLMGAFIPRVWWTAGVLSSGIFKAPEYGKNVVEMNVNSLYNWFPKYGAQFGWKEATASEVQAAANSGKMAVILAANKDAKKSGHITVVVPETAEHKAIGSKGIGTKMIVLVPLQSQAGAINKAYFASDWWKYGHQPVKMYVHED